MTTIQCTHSKQRSSPSIQSRSQCYFVQTQILTGGMFTSKAFKCIYWHNLMFYVQYSKHTGDWSCWFWLFIISHYSQWYLLPWSLQMITSRKISMTIIWRVHIQQIEDGTWARTKFPHNRLNWHNKIMLYVYTIGIPNSFRSRSPICFRAAMSTWEMMLIGKETFFRGNSKYLQFHRIYGTKHLQNKIFGTQKKEYKQKISKN